jgi:hypothetical protein
MNCIDRVHNWVIDFKWLKNFLYDKLFGRTRVQFVMGKIILKQSSANSRWDIVGVPLHIFALYSSPLATALWISDVRPSATMMNM